jgi:hypothetical protein
LTIRVIYEGEDRGKGERRKRVGENEETKKTRFFFKN